MKKLYDILSGLSILIDKILLINQNMCYSSRLIDNILFLKYRVSDQASKASAIGATYRLVHLKL